MSPALLVTHPAHRVAAFDEVGARCVDRETSFPEIEALKESPGTWEKTTAVLNM